MRPLPTTIPEALNAEVGLHPEVLGMGLDSTKGGGHVSSPIHTHYINIDSIPMEENMVVHDPIAILSNKAISWKGFF